ncbi:MAG: T9SS type A sorting domain-containing protein [Saprospiraceae bacterium]|nr:T9SS type A sorting domain-containing protein [Saprospiraceae bacterium]
MNLRNCLLLFFAFTISFQLSAQERYLDELFTDVTVTSNVVYGVNATILLISDPNVGEAIPQPLIMNVYEPTGDTETERPLVIYLHTGNFLPQPAFCSIGGQLIDDVLVEISTRLAKRGYVVATIDYRLGWNPVASTQSERTLTLINAAYRGVQDIRTCIRYFKKDVVEGTNQFGVDTSRITVWGQGTGGYASLAAATIDQYEDIVLPKFTFDFMGIPVPMVIPAVNGDIYGTSVGIVPAGTPPPFTVGDTLCYPNHVGYNSDFQLCVNMGGALGDISWLDASDPPMISFHVPNDSLAPYTEGILIVPTTGDLVVEVQGSYVIQQEVKALGNNAVFAGQDWNDEYTAAANLVNDGADGLFPFVYPVFPDPTNPPNGVITVSAPWEWWDQAAYTDVYCLLNQDFDLNTIGLAGNPLMSETQGMAYVDSIMGYFLPRACLALDLGCDISAFVSTQEVLTAAQVNLEMRPNPATQEVYLESGQDSPMLDVMVYDLSGRLLQSHMNQHTNEFILDRNNLPTGMYLVKIRFEKGMITQKLIYK